MSEVERPARAPTDMNTVAHLTPTWLKAPARGALSLRTLWEEQGVVQRGAGAATVRDLLVGLHECDDG